MDWMEVSMDNHVCNPVVCCVCREPIKDKKPMILMTRGKPICRRCAADLAIEEPRMRRWLKGSFLDD